MLDLEKVYVGTKIREKKTGKEYVVVESVAHQESTVEIAKWYVTCACQGEFYNLNLISDDYEFVTVLTEKQLDILYSKFKLKGITLNFDIKYLSVPFSYQDIRKLDAGSRVELRHAKLLLNMYQDVLYGDNIRIYQRYLTLTLYKKSDRVYSIETLLSNNNGYYHCINSIDIDLDKWYSDNREELKEMLLYSYLLVDDFDSYIKPFGYSFESCGIASVMENYLRKSTEKVKSMKKRTLLYCGFCYLKELNDDELKEKLKANVLPHINSLTAGHLYIRIKDNLTELRFECYLTKEQEDGILDTIAGILKEELQEVGENLREYFEKNLISPCAYSIENGFETNNGVYNSFSELLDAEMPKANKERLMEYFLSRW